MFSASLRFTPAGLARKNAPGVFVVIARERRATRSGGFTGATSAAPPAGLGPFFGHAALSVAYVERLHCSLRLAWPKYGLRQADERNGNRP